ncbi:MAG: GntR family transcriptional regulator [Planctomycetota bacterium]|jgi:DNA-binding GntR family transcriptional regulator|nr:GntR family transcriptional regulator [Planctomycetota bacterium]
MEAMVRSGTLADQVEDTIRKQIVFGEIKLGSRISEQQLADGLGVSKAPIRRALLRLQEEDLVEILPQKGTYVFKPDEEQLKSACLLRSLLEPVAIIAAYERARDPFLAALRAIYRKMEVHMADDNYRKYIIQDMYFHDQFFEYCRNPYLKKSYRIIRSILAVLRVQLKLDGKHLKKSFAEHREIIESLEKDDRENTLAILDRHIAFNENSYWHNISRIVQQMYAAKHQPQRISIANASEEPFL